MSEIASALVLTLVVGVIATALVALPAILLAYLLARLRFAGREAVSALLSLPLVLPPTAVGFLLLWLFSVDGPLGAHRLGFDPGVVLTIRGAIVAEAVIAFPLVLRTARVAIEGVDPRLEAVARTLGHGPLAAALRFTLPMARRGLIAALLLGFARAVGEFGATMVIAGSIPGRTRTLASAIYAAQQGGRERESAILVAVALGFGFAAIVVTERLSRRVTA